MDQAGKQSVWASVAGMLAALMGVLVATSFFNTASSGLPLFYACVLIPIASVVNPHTIALRAKIKGHELWIYSIVGLVAMALVAVTTIQMLWFAIPADSQAVHLAARLMFLLYFAICVRYLRGGIAWTTLIWLRRLLIVVFFYGVYQLPAKLLGMPLFLDWLRNNKSYMNYGYDAAGWTAMVRSTSVFAEPSQGTIPVVVAILLNMYLPVTRPSRSIGWLAILLFAATSASRTTWLTIVGLALAYFFANAKMTSKWLDGHRLTPISLVLLAAVLLPGWAIVASGSSLSDLSQQERSGGIVLAIYMIRDSPVIGFGWNSAQKLSIDYLRDVRLPYAENVEGGFIQNMVVSYWQQAGLPGLALALFPFIAVWRWSTAPQTLRWATLGSFLVASAVGGDIGYLSLTWLWIALLINFDSIHVHLKEFSSECIPLSRGISEVQS